MEHPVNFRKMANFGQKVPFITGHPVFFKKSADFLGKSPPETVLINQCFGKMKAKKCLKTSVFEK